MNTTKTGQKSGVLKVLLAFAALYAPVCALANPGANPGLLLAAPAERKPVSFAFELGILPPPVEQIPTHSPTTHSYRDLRVAPVKGGLAQLRYGVAVDLALPGSGNFDLTFTHRRNPSKPPQRYKFQLDSIGPAIDEPLWTVGAIVGRGRHGDFLQAVPQFRVNLPKMTGLPGKGEVMLQYARFRSNSGDVTESSMPQASLNWAF